jgi:hypothetical protein
MTHEGPDIRENTCTVPLSLQTHTSFSSGRKATPYISALSDPLLNTRISFPESVSHIRTRVPRDEVVASILPDCGTVRVFKEESCAAIIETGCFDGGGGGRDGGTEGGGPTGVGGIQGGRCTNCTCPICRPGKARRVEYAPVAIASKPSPKSINRRYTYVDNSAHLEGYHRYRIQSVERWSPQPRIIQFFFETILQAIHVYKQDL